MHFNAKKFFLVGFFLILLLGIPLSVYFLQQQQTIQQQAAKSTNFSFTPTSSQSSPIAKKVGEDVVLDVMVNPGTNVVTSIKLEIQYDPDVLEAGSDAFQTNPLVFPTVFSGPTYESGKITAILSVGGDATKAIQTNPAKAATITFKALATTNAGTPTQVTYNTLNSNATSRGAGDQFQEDVLLGVQPAFIEIADAEEPPPSEPTEPPAEPTEPPVVTESPEPEPTSVINTNSAPTCIAMGADQTSGKPPLAVNFTASGSDSDGTLRKATFNFGDGQVSDVTSGGGIGSPSASIQLTHTYTAIGSFRATAIFTDNNGGISSTTNCSQTISVLGDATATPTIAASGSTEVLFGFGALSLLLMIGGGLIFLML